MRFPFLQLFCFLLLLGLCTNCLHPRSSARLIPKDVTFASRVQVLRTTFQVKEWRNLLRDEFELDLDADTISTPLFLGSAKAYLFGDLFKKNQNYIGASIAIINRPNLEKFIKKSNPGIVFKEYKGFRYFLQNKNVTAWSKRALLLLNARQADTHIQSELLLKRIIDLPESEKLFYTNPNFKKILKNDQDVAFWLNVEKLSDIKEIKTFAKNLPLKNNYWHFIANFDEGVVHASTEFFTSPQMYQAYQTMLSGKVSTQLVADLPIASPAVLMAMGLKTEGMKQFIKDIEWTEKADNLTHAITLSLDQFLDMFTGEMVVAMKNAHPLIPEKKDSLHHITPSDLVLGLNIRNTQTYDSLMYMLETSSLLEKKQNYDLFFSEVYIMRHANSVYITKDSTIKNDFLQNIKFKNKDILKQSSDKWLLLHADENLAHNSIEGKGLAQDILKAVLKNKKVQMESATLELESLKKDKKDMTGNSIVLFKDKNENSLVALLEIFKEIVYQTKMRLDPNFFEDK